MDDFRYLSYYYDQFVGADYPRISSYIDRKLKCANLSGNYGVDLGCGSGTLTFLLADLGYDMIGIDRSEGMLMQAMEKKAPDSTVLFSQQDLTDFELYGPADFMVSTLDCLNYLEDASEVEKFIKNCSAFLKPNGLFILDFNSLYKYERILDGQNYVFETEDTFCVWENEFEGDHMYYDLTYFARQGDKYQRFEDHQMQTYFDVGLIKDILEKQGFEILSLEDDYFERCVTSDTQRYVLTARKRRI